MPTETLAVQSPPLARATRADVERIRDVIYQVAGIFHADHRFGFLEDRCSKRLEQTGCRSLRDYYQLLTTSASRSNEMVELLNSITIGETCFFRNTPQLDAIRKAVIPELMAAKNHLPFKRLRIWSAGCSTGEEAYTLAIMLLEEAQLSLKNVTVEVLATDLNERSLEKAREGVYGEYAIRNIPQPLRSKYFTAVGSELRVRDEVRKLVQFSRLNLLDQARMTFMKNMDVILCCNVMIYFDLAARKRVVQHFHSNLLPSSYLFLGHSESLFGVSNDFALIHFPGATGYRRTEHGKGGTL
jgi:chemotaxis protein methyltransferase CheR